uniref:Uncharacterized protein n=1 Tax=Romanomermis culicivorax TaxID=13658 RepID=A0A915JZJ6_ROMCU
MSELSPGLCSTFTPENGLEREAAMGISRSDSCLHEPSTLPAKTYADYYHYDPLDELGFEMSQKDDEIQWLNVYIDKMANLIIG